MKKIELSLTEEQWVEVICALETKEGRVERGLYDEFNDQDNSVWVKTLKSAREHIEQKCEESGVSF